MGGVTDKNSYNGLTCPLDDDLDPLESCRVMAVGWAFAADWDGEVCVDSWRMVGITLDDLLGSISITKDEQQEKLDVRIGIAAKKKDKVEMNL